MGQTAFGVNHALARKHWSNDLAVEAEVRQYFRKFMGKGDNTIIKTKTELSKEKGDKITVGIRMKLSGDGIEGDNIIEGTTAEEAIDFYDDALLIDQRRKGTKSKGKMSEQRVPYNIRLIGRDALSTWYGEDYDQQTMIYLAGARGVATNFHVPTTFTGRAGNTVTAPDSTHQIYGGTATSKATIASTSKMTLSIIEKLIAKAETLDPMIQPVSIGGDKKFVLLMHTWQAYSMRTATTDNDWMDISKAAGSRGGKNPVYQNSLGEYADVIMHKHRNVIRFDDYGSGSDVAAARALFLGTSAGMIAWGGAQNGVGRYSWNEEFDDRGNALAITAGAIYGVKQSIFNSKTFGLIAVDTACADPNAA